MTATSLSGALPQRLSGNVVSDEPWDCALFPLTKNEVAESRRCVEDALQHLSVGRIEECITALHRALAITPRQAAGFRYEIYVALMTAKRRRGDYAGAWAAGVAAYGEIVTQERNMAAILGTQERADSHLRRLPLIRAILQCSDWVPHAEGSDDERMEARLRQELADGDRERRVVA